MTDKAKVNFNSPRSPATKVQRAALSHELRKAALNGPPVVTSDWLDRFLPSARLPSVEHQATNLIRLVGNHIREHGEGFEIEEARDTARVGALNPNRLEDLRDELVNEGLVKLLSEAAAFSAGGFTAISSTTFGLTLRGWARYEAELVGDFAARYGFMALKFNDETLDALVENCIRPAVQREIGYQVVDMRNVARAGVIDNILREQIRDSAFVLVDLTHDNSGAYWEAGYAEGLGKPVVYICERSKFDRAKTHFDTNHCTTVLWEADKASQFEAELIATIRRSLNLFASS